MIHLTFMQWSNGRLAKTVRADRIDPYPNAATFLSHHKNVETIDQFAEELRTHSEAGHCLHVGDLQRPLMQPGKRAGLASRTSQLQWFVIDVDGLDMPNYNGVTPTLPAAAEAVIQAIGSPSLRDTAYIAQASTKYGLAGPALSLHLFFLLDRPVTPAVIKAWFKHLNLESEHLQNNIRLSQNGHSLCWPLDLSCADIARLIYIAPPIFMGREDPFPDARSRIVVVHRPRPCVPAAELVSTHNDGRTEARVKRNLRTAAGFDAQERTRTRQLTINGDRIELLLNPAPARLTLHHEAREFCYYNLGDGDSAAYYHPVNKPDIIFNFKGEPAFRWADVDPDGHAAYCEANAEGIAKLEPIKTFMVINRATDRPTKVWHNRETNEVSCLPSGREAVADFYAENGMLEPEYLETWNIEYNPTLNWQVDYNGKHINVFKPSPLMKNGVTHEIPEPLDPENHQAFAQYCPHIWLLITHMAGYGGEEVARFLNWLSCILQTRRKTGTAFIFQGVEGTGKGTLYSQVLRPLFGEHNAVMKLSGDIADQFNAWRRTAMLIAVDEFKVPNNAAGEKIVGDLRSWITEENGTVRAMHQMGENVTLYDNYVFFTNQRNMLPIPPTDRRFNICPRQERPLREIVNTETLYEHIAEELPMFSSMLHQYAYNEALARTVINNEAKVEARRSSRSMAEEFISAVIEGDLDFMLQVFETIQQHTSPDTILQLDAARRCVIRMVQNFGRVTHMSINELTTLYNTMFDQRMSPMAVGKMATRFGLNAVRYYDEQGQRTRGIECTFNKTTLNEEERAQFLRMQHGHIRAVETA